MSSNTQKRTVMLHHVPDVTRDVHCCVTVDYQQIANDNIANQIHGFTIDYGKFILNSFLAHGKGREARGVQAGTQLSLRCMKTTGTSQR